MNLIIPPFAKNAKDGAPVDEWRGQGPRARSFLHPPLAPASQFALKGDLGHPLNVRPRLPWPKAHQHSGRCCPEGLPERPARCCLGTALGW